MDIRAPMLNSTECAKLQAGVFPWPGDFPGSGRTEFESYVGDVQEVLLQLKNPGDVDLLKLACVLQPGSSFFKDVCGHELIKRLNAIHRGSQYEAAKRQIAGRALCFVGREGAQFQYSHDPYDACELFHQMSNALFIDVGVHPLDDQRHSAAWALNSCVWHSQGLIRDDSLLRALAQRAIESPAMYEAASTWAHTLRWDLDGFVRANYPQAARELVDTRVGDHLNQIGDLTALVQSYVGAPPTRADRSAELARQSKRVGELQKGIYSLVGKRNELIAHERPIEIWLAYGALVADIRLEAGERTSDLLEDLWISLSRERRALTTPADIQKVDTVLALYFQEHAQHSYQVADVLAEIAQYTLTTAAHSKYDEAAGELFTAQWKVVLERVKALEFEGKDELLASLSVQLEELGKQPGWAACASSARLYFR